MLKSNKMQPKNISEYLLETNTLTSTCMSSTIMTDYK